MKHLSEQPKWDGKKKRKVFGLILMCTLKKKHKQNLNHIRELQSVDILTQVMNMMARNIMT